jgi:hypothetical protein
VRRVLSLLVVLAVALSGCGGESRGGAASDREPTASLWVTRDRGADVVLTTDVPAGLTVMQALQAAADVETRYGGRFVQAINGIEGSLTKGRDWFYFVNGIEPDVGAVEVRLRPGDVAWWDYRSWGASMQQPVVVGAFPEPFRHGWSGRRRPVELRFPPDLAGEARALERVLGGRGGRGSPNVFVLEVREGADGAELTAKRGPSNDAPVKFTLAGSLPAVRAAASALARDPSIVRFLYEARFDERGRVLR